MSDNYQTLAFDSIEPEDAASVAEQSIRWLIANSYISEELSDCVYGSKDGLGHKPGGRWREIVDEQEDQRLWNVWASRTGKPPPQASERLADFLRLQINGVEASSKRSAHCSGENCEASVSGVCPACGVSSVPTSDLNELAEYWWNEGASRLQCPECSVSSSLQDWDWQPHWAFSEAALTFWNWPPISASAVTQLSEALNNIRIRQIVGRL